MRRRGLPFAERREMPRRKARIAGLAELGRVEPSWAVWKAHDAVLALPGGELALLVSHGGTGEIVVAARSEHAAHAAATRLTGRLRSAPRRDKRVAVRFWTSTG